MANISGGEYAADGRLEWQSTVSKPIQSVRELAICEDEAVFVQQDALSEPPCLGTGADEAEQSCASQLVPLARSDVLQVTRSRRVSPLSRSTSTPVMRSILGSASILPIRYRDMVWSRS